MSDTSPVLSLPLIQASQAQKHVTHNEALERLDLLVQTILEAFDATDPPAAPAEGESWALGPDPVLDWAGQGGKIATWRGGGWQFIAPREGWRAWGRAEGVLKIHTAAGWSDLAAGGELQNLPGLGIATTSDGTNRLAVSSPASLFDHAGAGHRMKVNKAVPADTASLLFQTNFSGRAEMGLAGHDDFSIKVSADGTGFAEALRADAATGHLTAPAGMTVSGTLAGTAVQQDAADTTAGRLALAQHCVLRGGIVGPVSQTAGLPTGAVIERGSNANGEYVRFADGTQICWKTTFGAFRPDNAIGALFISGSDSWTFPAPFDTEPAVQGNAKSSNRWVTTGTVTAANANLQVFAPNQQASAVPIRVMAIGEWF